MKFELNEDTAEQLRHLLAHPAWIGFFADFLEQCKQDAIASLLDPSEARRQDFPDDFLRAQVGIITSIQQLGPTTLAVWDRGTAEEAERQRVEQAYDDAAALGVYRPQN